MAVYTHDFEFEINSKEINGEMEFNVDGQASVLPTGEMPNLTTDELESFSNFVKSLKRIFDVFGGIKKINIEEK